MAFVAPSVRLSLVVVSTALLVACHKPPKAPVEEDLSSAFSELSHPSSTPSAGAPQADAPPRGPVYPAPFTAAQIRAATKNGRQYKYRVTVPQKPPHEYSIAFRNVDDAGAELELPGDKRRRLGWQALQQDAEFPKDRVKTRSERITVPAGTFDCVVYRLEADAGEVWTYFFAKKLPGAPVLFYVERAGKKLRTTTLVQHTPGK